MVYQRLFALLPGQQHNNQKDSTTYCCTRTKAYYGSNMIMFYLKARQSDYNKYRVKGIYQKLVYRSYFCRKTFMSVYYNLVLFLYIHRSSKFILKKKRGICWRTVEFENSVTDKFFFFFIFYHCIV